MSEWRSLLASSLSDPALFDEGVEAARNACVAGASIAAAIMASAAWYSNPLTGAPALSACMQRLSDLAFDVEAWQQAFLPRPHPDTGDPDFSPGFGFVNATQASAIVDACTRIVTSARDDEACACRHRRLPTPAWH